MNKTNTMYGNSQTSVVDKRAAQPEIPAAIEVLQNETVRLAKEVIELMGRLSPVTKPSEPKVERENEKALPRNGLLQPLDELTAHIASSADTLSNLRSRLMI